MQTSNPRRLVSLVALVLSAGVAALTVGSTVLRPQVDTSRGLGQVRRLLEARLLRDDLAMIGRRALCS